jgi:uncharacterized SAM-binding protein YcdF (DUF218 family)
MWRVLRWSAGLLACGVILVVFHAPMLAAAARAWMVNPPPAKADAIVLLGGDPNSRAFEAARLYHDGWAPMILVMSPKLRATDNLGVTIPQAELARRILLSNSVPAAAIQVRGADLTSTFAEVLTARAWLKESGGHSLLIPTGPFHSRRVRWVFRKSLGDSAQVTVTTIHPEVCEDWWRHEESLIDFQNELVKFAYYLLKY